MAKTPSSQLSKELTELLKTRYEDTLRDDDQGYPVAGERPYWYPPPVVTPEMVNVAKYSLSTFDAMLEDAAPEDIRAWLAKLGLLGAGNMPEDRATAKLVAYSAFLFPLPTGILTEETAERAARKFKWFPSYAEIVEFLDAETLELKNMRQRARMIAEWAGPKQPPKPAPRRRLMHNGKPISDMTPDELKQAAQEARG